MILLPRRAAFGLLLASGTVLPARADPPPGRGGGGGGQGRGNQGGGNQGGGGRGSGNPGSGNQGGGNQGRGGPPGQAARFGGSETVIIRDWRTANPYWSPRPLPPGQMRQLARGKPLPPGIARQALPPPLLAQLPVYPGASYAMIGTSVVLLSAAGIVLDILGGLF